MRSILALLAGILLGYTAVTHGQIIVGGGGGGLANVSVCGADTQVLYNDATVCGAISGFTFNKSTKFLTVSGGTQTAVLATADTTAGHTLLFQAYDVDGTALKTFMTLTNNNTPDLTISAPSGGSLSVGGLLLTTTVSPASSGTRYLCIGTTGAVTSSATACSGT